MTIEGQKKAADTLEAYGIEGVIAIGGDGTFRGANDLSKNFGIKCMENYRSILEYQEEQIRIQTGTGKIRIAGKRLGIAYYREECMCTVGEIHSIEYQQ